jgi:hypothetical protein
MLPDTIYQSKLVHNEMRRERSLAIHDNLMHLPAGESVLERLLRRLRALTLRTSEARPRASIAESIDANRPPAFSK